MPIEYVTGDLLATTNNLDAIAQGCNTMGRMGLGIAKPIREKYGEAMYEQYAIRCKTKMFRPGGLHFWASDDKPHLYNLGTQDQPGPHARLGWIAESITIAVGHAFHANLNRIGLPRIGAGIGGLDWKHVEGVLIATAELYPEVTLVVYTLPETPLKDSEDWSHVLGVAVLDPDGWDRKNFLDSWAEEITEEEFRNRAARST